MTNAKDASLQPHTGLDPAIRKYLKAERDGSVNAYTYPFDSRTDFYVITSKDRVRGQTGGVSAAVGVRYRFGPRV